MIDNLEIIKPLLNFDKKGDTITVIVRQMVK